MLYSNSGSRGRLANPGGRSAGHVGLLTSSLGAKRDWTWGAGRVRRYRRAEVLQSRAPTSVPVLSAAARALWTLAAESLRGSACPAAEPEPRVFTCAGSRGEEPALGQGK